MQTALPPHFDYIGDVLQSLVNDIVTSIVSEEGPNEVLKFFASLQPLFKDNLFSEGFIGCFADSSSPREVIQKIQKSLRKFHRCCVA